MEGKFVWTKHNIYSSYGVGTMTNVNSNVNDNPHHSINGDPRQPFFLLRAYPKRIKDLLTKPEYAQANILKDATTADGKQVKELYIIEKI